MAAVVVQIFTNLLVIGFATAVGALFDEPLAGLVVGLGVCLLAQFRSR